MKRVFLIFICVAALGTLDAAAQPAVNNANVTDSVLSKQIERLDSTVNRLKWRQDSLEIVKGQREELLDRAESMFDRSLSAQNAAATWVGVLVALLAIVFALAGAYLFKAQKQ